MAQNLYRDHADSAISEIADMHFTCRHPSTHRGLALQTEPLSLRHSCWCHNQCDIDASATVGAVHYSRGCMVVASTRLQRALQSLP